MKNCNCLPVSPITKNKEKPISPFWLGTQFLSYCVKQGWLKQEGAGGRGTKWTATVEGEKVLKEKFKKEKK